MKCSYHPGVDSHEICSACSRPLCAECAHQIKGKFFCQDCLVRGAEWAAALKDLRMPADSPKRAATCALIPGMGAVYNNEYMKAITYFAVFAALIVMGDRVNGVFGFGAFAFLIFTMFDAYRTAEYKARVRMESGLSAAQPIPQDRTVAGWGVVLIVLGVIFLLQNLIPYYLLHRSWPLIFILLGGYLVYRAIHEKEDARANSPGAFTERKEF